MPKTKAEKKKIATKYVRDSLQISYGSAKRGIAMIGIIEFKKTVEKVMKALP